MILIVCSSHEQRSKLGLHTHIGVWSSIPEPRDLYTDCEDSHCGWMTGPYHRYHVLTLAHVVIPIDTISHRHQAANPKKQKEKRRRVHVNKDSSC